MAQGSAFSSQNFSISYYNRLPRGGEWIGDLDIAIQDWRHSITAFGGFDSASFSLSQGQAELNGWIENGLFRPIVVYDNFLDPVWEGFIDSITINQAGLSITIGPVTRLSNRVFAVYSGIDTSVYPPQIGVRKKTPTINNTLSQEEWGIWWEVISLAGVTDANADLLVDMYLSEHGYPDTSSNFSFSNEEISLSFTCSGWNKILNYPFNYTDDSGTVTISQRIKQVLDDEPNGWLSSDQSQIADNDVAIPLYESDDQLAIEHIRGVTAMGDSDNHRHIFGIYQDRRAVYEKVSDQIDYTISLTDPERQILDAGNSVVSPWRIRPGKWIFFNDFISGLGVPYEELERDPRMLRIESVQFDMRTPYNVQFTGGVSSRYEQRSARLGLRGTEV